MDENVDLVELEFHYDKVLSPEMDEYGKKEPIKKLKIPKDFLESVFSWDLIFPWPTFFKYKNIDTPSDNRTYLIENNYQLWMIERRLFFFESVEFLTSWFSDPKYHKDMSYYPLLNQYVTFSITISSTINELDQRIEDVCKDLDSGLYRIAPILNYINLHYTVIKEGETFKDSIEDSGLNESSENESWEILIDLNDKNHVERFNQFSDMIFSITDSLIGNNEKSKYPSKEHDMEEEDESEHDMEEEDYLQMTKDESDFIEEIFGDGEFQQEIADDWEYDPDNPNPEHFS